MNGADRGTRQTAPKTKRGVSAPIVVLTIIGLVWVVNKLSTETDREPPPRSSRGTTGSAVEDNGGTGTGEDWRETIVVNLAGCTQGYGGSYRCTRTGGYPETARWARWTVTPFPTADKTKLHRTQEFTCLDAKTRFEQGKRCRCTAGYSFFWLRPE